MEGLWFRLMMDDGLTREKGHAAAIEYPVPVFPGHIIHHGPK